MTGDKDFADEQFDRIVVRTVMHLTFGLEELGHSIPEKDLDVFLDQLRTDYLTDFYQIEATVPLASFRERLGDLANFCDVTIHNAALCLAGMNLRDTAGLHDNDPVRKRRTAEEIRTCDMAIAVIAKNLDTDGDFHEHLSTIAARPGRGFTTARLSFVHNLRPLSESGRKDAEKLTKQRVKKTVLPRDLEGAPTKLSLIHI